MRWFVIVSLALFVSFGCSNQGNSPEDGATFGKIRILADESLFPLVIAEEEMFEHNYNRAQLDIKYLPGIQAMNEFLKDTARTIISARSLTPEEIAYLKKLDSRPITNQIATDAVAFMVHPNNPDTALTCESILKVLKGDVTSWDQLSPNNRSGNINLVFDNQNSSTVQFVMDMIKLKKLPANAYALKDNPSVVEYVAKHPGALGIIGYSWISDYDDPLGKKLRSEAKLMAVSVCEGDNAAKPYKPYAANMIDKLYPFRRDIFIITREGRSGLGTGFASFIASDIGQRIIQKAGIPPYYKLEYNIELRSEPFKLEK
ncbi:MAG: substrate-binding domain-containing protein [Haliscomenobacter sp.]|uniref:PstS family phosphate ABC transporter substrate-binding protein n=1 Tax=Haliscomenobacter sp. TaxID=2717303 RepID=UPI0029A6A60C|nr:substrate-binding domain-containing protein [Haliscomenobacter sp.]MDX2071485.1 substrate-binding domain-containing protein [Haliscomenobacter sp.]